eukprot:CAMPEP_0204511884 /NCGR_PEP_ID=MMETSP0661-20131031/668_1 /ASSEMBLY_ACC=CAM_ASM_000606 /TAXON_ID=109239 /ORGANISM="Alexandrium margalefi, Strain AMGDE01CS-322" /LENGTH=429 /DNA_ID=CAMNT_0051516985 /DNA_START=272 /DNA_END=1560 /DNA_ORIENTATION=-
MRPGAPSSEAGRGLGNTAALLDGLDDLGELGQAVVAVGEVQQVALGHRGRQPLDEGLQLRVPAEDAAAPVPGGKGLAPLARVLAGVAEARRVGLGQLAVDQALLVLRVAREHEGVQRDDVGADAVAFVSRPPGHVRVGAVESKAPAVALVPAELLRADDEDDLVIQHLLAEEHADEALRADGEPNLLLHVAPLQDPTPEELVGKVCLQVGVGGLDRSDLDARAAQRLGTCPPEVQRPGLLHPAAEGHDLLQEGAGRARQLPEVGHQAEALRHLRVEHEAQVETRHRQPHRVVLILRFGARDGPEERRGEQGAALAAREEDLVTVPLRQDLEANWEEAGSFAASRAAKGATDLSSASGSPTPLSGAFSQALEKARRLLRQPVSERILLSAVRRPSPESMRPASHASAKDSRERAMLSHKVASRSWKNSTE